MNRVWLFWIVVSAIVMLAGVAEPLNAQQGCDPSYLDICIAPPLDLDCGDISERNFRVVGADPHRFDRDKDGIGCEQ